MDLTGKTALVTGASSGLGEHFARVLAARGARVTVAARRVEKLEALCSEIEGAEARALDVTDPSVFSESTPKETVLWEFSNADDAHLGQTFSRPTVALLNNGRWAVITGNGPEDTAVLPDSEAGDAQLFIIYLDGGIDGSWTKGEDYLRITTTVGKKTDRNGLFTPALIDLDGNGTADRAYAGDLKGRMWAFDLSSSDQTKWAVAHKNKKPLIKVKKDQPITITQPEFSRRMKDMNQIGGGMMGMGQMPEILNLVVNSNHPLIGKILKEKSKEKQQELAKQATDLALLSQNMLKGEELTKFIKRSLDLI